VKPVKRKAPMKPARRPGPAACWVIAAMLLTLAACSSSSPAAPGEQAASSTRTQVAREYWNVLAAIYLEIFPAAGANGYFSACPAPSGQPADQVAYNIDNGITSLGGRLTPGPFIAQVEQTLQSHGWSRFTPQHGTAVSTKNGYRIRLRQVTGSLAIMADLTLSGSCVTVGSELASAAPRMTLNDDYPDSEVSASPVPTKPLPSP
jgi:hypothetical protein